MSHFNYTFELLTEGFGPLALITFSALLIGFIVSVRPMIRDKKK